jgi:hypothetical protein
MRNRPALGVLIQGYWVEIARVRNPRISHFSLPEIGSHANSQGALVQHEWEKTDSARETSRWFQGLRID